MSELKPALERDDPGESKPRLRPLQVTASALAAVTGAFLASRLGVYGTVVGVGVMSVLSTLIGELYLRSLERSTEAARYATVAAKIRTVRVRADDGSTVASPHNPTAALPVVDPPTAVDSTVADAPAAGEASTQRAAAAGFLARFRKVGRLRWSAVALGSVATCVLAVLAITGIEAATGSKFSGGDGRTFTSLVDNSGNTPADDTEVDNGEPDQPEQPEEQVEPGQEQPATTPTPTPTDRAGNPTDSPTSSPEPGEPPAEDESPDATVPVEDDEGGPSDDGGP